MKKSLYENIKNVLTETTELEKNMKSKFMEALKYLDLVVVGYGGADVSIMSVLEEIKVERHFGLIWCGSDPDKLNWRVINLINNTPNSFFIQLDSFSTLVLKLWNTFKIPLINLVEEAQEKQKELESFIKNFNLSIQVIDSVTVADKIEFEASVAANEYLRLAYEETDIQKKLELYNKGISYYPSNPDLYNDRGITLAFLFKHLDAINDYNKAIELSKNDPFAYIFYANRASSYHRVGEIKKAFDDLDRALSLAPTYSFALSLKGYYLSKSSDDKEALYYLNKAVELSPNIPDGYVNRGLYYDERGEYKLAEKDYLQAEKIGIKDKSGLYNNLAVLYRHLKQFDKAQEYIEKAKQHNPYFPLIYGTLSLIYADQGDKENFYKYLEIALEKGCPAWNYLDDYGFDKYRNDERLKKLINKYKK